MSESSAEPLGTVFEIALDRARGVPSTSDSAQDLARAARLKSIHARHRLRRLVYDRHGVVFAMAKDDELPEGNLVGVESLIVSNLALYERVIQRLFRAGMGIEDLQNSVTPEVAEKLRAMTADLDGVIRELRQAAFDEARLLDRVGLSETDGESQA